MMTPDLVVVVNGLTDFVGGLTKGLKVGIGRHQTKIISSVPVDVRKFRSLGAPYQTCIPGTRRRKESDIKQ